MKNQFTIDQKALCTTLGSMQSICTRKTIVPATALILFHVTPKELILKGTDLEISLQYSCPMLSCSIENQQFLVSGKKIFDVVRELDREITFTLSSNQINITSGSVNVSLNIKDAQEFPPLPERIENLMHIERSFLVEMLTKVSFLIPQSNANPALNGLFIEITPQEFKMTSTDGHCLAQVQSDKYVLAQEKKWLLPRRAVFEVKRIIESVEDEIIFLGICSNQLVFSGEQFNFFSKLLAEEFPAYGAIMKKDSFVPATVNRQEFVKTLRRSASLLSGQFLATQFEFSKDELKVSLQNNEVGTLQESLLVKDFDQENLLMRFYSPYLLNGLQTFTQEQVHCFLKNNTRPIIFESKDQQSTMVYLVMPVTATT